MVKQDLLHYNDSLDCKGWEYLYLEGNSGRWDMVILKKLQFLLNNNFLVGIA